MKSAPHPNAVATVIRSLAAERSPAGLVDTQGVFMFLNEAWDRLATERGGAPACLGSALIGTRWLDHIQGDEVRRIHAAALERALQAQAPHPKPVILVGESNTPDTAALVSTRLEPVLQGGETVAVRMVHLTVRQRPVAEVYEVVDRPPESYRGGDARIVGCSCCRRVRDPADPERWDFVPQVLAAPVPVTHDICPLCLELHYGCTPEI